MENRARGALLGQICGDSLGSLVEFLSETEIKRKYPKGVTLLADGGPHFTLAGQATDDTEMAMCLVHSLLECGTYDREDAKRRYTTWANSRPFDIGHTTSSSLAGIPCPESQANGALMRVAPLGVFGATRSQYDLVRWASEDCSITHVNPICQEVNALYVLGIAAGIQGGTARDVFDVMHANATYSAVKDLFSFATFRAPLNYKHQMGWVITAFHNALYQLLHAKDATEGIIDTVRRGGDTDTNGAICGALLGSIYGGAHFPEQWVTAVRTCHPSVGNAPRPRPDIYWADGIEVQARLLLSLPA